MPMNIQHLLAHEEPGSVSIYLPTERSGREVKQNPIRLENLLRRARMELEVIANEQAASLDVDAVLAPATELLESPGAWADRQDGLALFLAPSHTERFMLPHAFEPLVTCASRFHLRPILPLAHADARFHLLALSRGAVTLYACSRFDIEPLPQGDIPQDMEEALWMDDPEPVLQHHASGSSPRGGVTQQHHGQGGRQDARKTRLVRFFRRVDQAVTQRTAAEGNLPLVLAADRPQVAIYGDANTHPHLLPTAIIGNPDRVAPKELHAAAWALVRAELDEPRRTAIEAYRARAGTGTTAAGAMAVHRFAVQGRVATVLFGETPSVWATLSEDGINATVHDEREAGDVDLIDAAICTALRRGADAFQIAAGDLPPDAGVCALLRH